MHRLLQIGNKKALCMALKSAMLPVSKSNKDIEKENKMTDQKVAQKTVDSIPATTENGTVPEQVTFAQVNQQVAKRKAAAALHDAGVKAWSDAGTKMNELKAKLMAELDTEDRLNLLFGYQAAKAIFATQGGLTEAQQAMWKVDGQGNPMSTEKPEGLGATRPLASGNETERAERTSCYDADGSKLTNKLAIKKYALKDVARNTPTLVKDLAKKGIVVTVK